MVLVDGSPGIGCPVISSLSGASLVVFVTEPSRSGFHDLQRVVQLTKSFNIPSAGIINKSNLNEDISREIRTYLTENEVRVLGEIPYCDCFSKAMLAKTTLVEYDDGVVSEKIQNIWNDIIVLFN